MTPKANFWKGFKSAALKGDPLQPHQKRVLDKLEKTDALLLYHGLGSGKTLSSIAATEGGKTDVVVPAALRNNYRKEVSKFTDGKSKRNILSYEAATKGELQGGDNLVLDEVQRINNATAGRTRAVLQAAPQYKKRILLSGTPIRNHPHELAPILRVLNPRDRRVPLDEDQFRQRFINEVRVKPGIIDRLRGVKPGISEQPKNLELLRDIVKGKVDYYAPPAEGFPSRADRVETVPMTDEQQKIYNFITNKANPAIAHKVRRGLPLSKREQLSLNSFMTGARISSNTPRPYGGKGESPKMQRALGDVTKGLQKDPNFKAVAYSNYLEGGVKEYASYLDQHKIPYGIFSGELSDKKRKALVDGYNKGAIKVLLISGAGSEGLDLKGTKMMQVLEPHWNSARTEQAIGRAIRFKSHDHLPEEERHVDVVHYHAVHPEKWYDNLLRRKRPTSADQYLSDLGKKKDALNAAFLNVLKKEGT